MKPTVYVLKYSLSNQDDVVENVYVYSTFEKAREAMLKDIEESKRDNFWWDKTSEVAEDGFIIESDNDNSFEAYEDGYYTWRHESWNIVTCEIDMDFQEESNISQKNSIEM